MRDMEEKEAKAWVKWFMAHASPKATIKLSKFAKAILNEESPCIVDQGKAIISKVVEPEGDVGDLPMWGNN